MKLLLAALICCCSFVCVEAQRFNLNSQLGVVDNNRAGRLCLTIVNPRLTAGTEVSFVTPHKKAQDAQND